MPITGHGYRRQGVRDRLSYERAITKSTVAAAAVAMEPASPARRGPTIGCDAPSAVARCFPPRDVSRRERAITSFAVAARYEVASSRVQRVVIWGRPFLLRGHFGDLWQLSKSPKIVASIFGSSEHTSPTPATPCRCTIITLIF
jgi:hypothetical protein